MKIGRIASRTRRAPSRRPSRAATRSACSASSSIGYTCCATSSSMAVRPGTAASSPSSRSFPDGLQLRAKVEGKSACPTSSGRVGISRTGERGSSRTGGSDLTSTGEGRCQLYAAFPMACASHVGSCGAAAASSPKAPGGIFRFNVLSAVSAFSGPSQAKARTASPAGRLARANCQRGACRSSTTCLSNGFQN